MKFDLRNLTLWFVVFAIILILLVLTFSKQGFYEYYVNKKTLYELEMKIDSLKKVNDSLSVEIELLKSNPEKIEKVAREKYGMIKPGEKIYKIKIRE